MNAKPNTKTKQTAKDQALAAALERARVELDLDTLETRKSDRLDFHDVAVWSIRDLVQQAFEAGYAAGVASK